MKILKEIKFFYEYLYKKREIINEESFYEKLNKIKCFKFNREELNIFEGFLIDIEILNFFKKMKNEKSFGFDGFISEFFKFFWRDLGIFIIRVINYFF